LSEALRGRPPGAPPRQHRATPTPSTLVEDLNTHSQLTASCPGLRVAVNQNTRGAAALVAQGAHVAGLAVCRNARPRLGHHRRPCAGAKHGCTGRARRLHDEGIRDRCHSLNSGPWAWSPGFDGLNTCRGRGGPRQLSRHVLPGVTRNTDAHTCRTLFLPCGLRPVHRGGRSAHLNPICGGAIQCVQLPGVRMGVDDEVAPGARLARSRGRRLVLGHAGWGLSLRHGRPRGTAGVEAAARRPLRRSRCTIETLQRAL
jgi:hypothetical protein